MDKILICGKTSLFSREALQYIAKTHDVILTGKKAAGADGPLPENVHTFRLGTSDSDFQKVFEAGELRAVWYVSGWADGGRGVRENASLDKVLRLCRRSGVERCIVLTEAADPADYRQLIEQWSGAQGEKGGVRIAVVQLPLLIQTGSPRGRLTRIFQALQEEKTVQLEGRPDTRLRVLHMPEMTALLIRMTDESWFKAGIFLAGQGDGRLDGLREALVSIRPDASIEYAPAAEPGGTAARGRGTRAPSQTAARFRIPASDPSLCDGRLEEMYRLPVSGDWAAGIAAQYQAFVEGGTHAVTLRERAAGALHKSGKLIGAVLDIVVMFLIAEYLGRITSDSVYFKIVDVRLLFVILMGMMHGLAAGLAAALMECVMLVIRYNALGISGLLLFYNVENWIPFVYYLTAGVISGYTHQKNAHRVRSVMAENALIRSKYLYLNEAYRESVGDRRELRTQILSEEESYQKLYGAVEAMSQRTPEAVCVEAVRVLRQLLDNETVSIYQMEEGGKRARLLSCCRENASRQVLAAADAPEMAEAVRTGGVWKNVRFLEKAPMYAAMVRYSRALGEGGAGLKEITLIVTVEKASRDQLSLWYMNHFRILCGLFENALEGAALRERVQV